MIKYWTIKLIVKLYFLGALYFSFGTLVAGASALGTHNPWRVPAIIDGVAVIGFIMRSEAFSTRTRKIGFRIQIVAGSISFVANVAAGQTIGDRITDGAMVVVYLGSEWLYDQIESAEAEKAAAKAAIDAKQAAAVAVAEQARLAQAAMEQARNIEAARAAERERAEIEAAKAAEAAARKAEIQAKAAATRERNRYAKMSPAEKRAYTKALREAREAEMLAEISSMDFDETEELSDVPVSPAYAIR